MNLHQKIHKNVAFVNINNELYLNDIDPNVAKSGGIQSQGAKGAAVVFYRNDGVEKDIAVRNGHFYALRCLEALGVEDAEEGIIRNSLVHYMTEEEISRLVEGLEGFFCFQERSNRDLTPMLTPMLIQGEIGELLLDKL